MATSSGESKVYALAKGMSEGIAIWNLGAEVGPAMKLNAYTDATTTIGIANRHGIGKLKHLDVQMLWIQQAIADKTATFNKVASDVNPADLLTKALGIDKFNRFVNDIGRRKVGVNAEGGLRKLHTLRSIGSMTVAPTMRLRTTGSTTRQWGVGSDATSSRGEPSSGRAGPVGVPIHRHCGGEE